ncbi:uncharacterized protein LOC121682254 isoform X1 [Alosa sapidissima]|uniref:uncharacterized protein LOC121682254 isoform X1 n=1 Tax=Alosa sapidissima TaxID=34773 RepID=UPI001C08839B|nr:uncharacterized protein LOC121682254 isoform X1 [Alosa sapidissima]XP_041918252.1 uncharacterized protein LOC121682254 isoform X1 [Alosa sapidissima]
MTTNRKAPERDALEHVVKAIDKTAHLEVKFINSVKGRGVFAKSHFEKGNFVVEYRGQLIKSEESQRRRRVYHSQCAVFLFDFYWQERLWCIDAAQEDGSLGRLVNDENIRPNCKMKKLIVEGKPHLCLFALRNIIPGEEITYNYGGTDWPWRNKIEEEPVETMSPAVEAPETSPQLLEAPETSPQLAVLSSVSEKKIEEEPVETMSPAVEAPETSPQLLEAPETSPQLAVLSSVSEKKIKEEPVETMSPAVEAPETSQQLAVLSSVSKKKIGKKRLMTKSAAVEAPKTSQPPAVLSTVSKKKIGKKRLMTKSAAVEAPKTSQPLAVLSTVSKKKIKEEPVETMSPAVEAPETSQQLAVLSSVSKKKIGKKRLMTKSAAVEAPKTSQPPAVLSTVSKKKIGKKRLMTKSAAVEAPKTSQPLAVLSTVSKKKIGKKRLMTKSAAVEAPKTSQPLAVLSTVSKKKIEEEPVETMSPAVEAPETSPQLLEAPETSPQLAVLSSVSEKKIKEEPVETMSPAVEAPETSQQLAVLSSVSKKKIGKKRLMTKSAAVEAPKTSQPPAVLSTVSKKKIGKKRLMTKSAAVEAPKTSQPLAVLSTVSKKKIEEEPVETMSPAVEAPETSPQLLEAPETSPQLAVLSSVSEKKIGKKRLMTKSAAVEAPKTSQPPAVLSTVSEKKIEEEPVVTNSTAVEAPQTSQQPAVLSSVSKKKIGEKRTVIESGLADRYETPEHCGLLSPKKKRCNLIQESSDQDQPYVPKLRRTKSIQINRQTDFDSYELFETSDESEEEYVPDTSEDSSDETDTSEVFETSNQKKITLRGRSLVRKGSALKRKRHHSRSVSCCRTHSFGGQSSETSYTEDPHGSSTLVCPDSTTSPTSDVADDLLTVPAVCKKEDGSRQYNKKQYCLYCKKGFIKMARHLERAHKNEKEVAQAGSFPKGSKQRRLHLEHLRNRGNFAHNSEVLNTGVGKLVPRKQPKDDSKPRDFDHCIYCQGYFTKKVMWRHMMICKFKPSGPTKPGKTRVQALCAFAVPPPPGVKAEFWKVLNHMIQDDVYFAVKSDVWIMEYGVHLHNKHGYDVGKHEYIRQKMRELGRLLICSRKTTPLKTIEDHMKPENFMHVVQAVQLVAGFVSESSTYKRPSLALKIGHSLVKISLLLEARASMQNNQPAAKDARRFRSVYEARWNELISAASLRTMHESKWNVPQLIPFTKDVQKLHSYLDMQQEQFYNELSSEPSKNTWVHLTKITLTQVMMFNRRRTGEVSKMPLSTYFAPNPVDLQEDVGMALSELEKKLCQHFRRLEIRGKRGRKVPVLLTPEMQRSLDLLVAKRLECGILKENGYLFARPSVLTCYRGSDCIRDFAKVCGIANYTSLTSTKLRKQTGTLSQVLNLSNTELDQLANFLGHDVRVHRQFYRLPEGTLQLAKISKVLLALEQGRLAEFKGKGLDDITIGPEESVNLDSDHEAQENVDSDTEVQRESDTQVQKRTQSVLRLNERESSSDGDDRRKSVQKKKSKTIHKPQKRRPWETEEIAAVEKHMRNFILTCNVPRKCDCDKCLKSEPVALKNRDWKALKFYIKNRITALKRKM